MKKNLEAPTGWSIAQKRQYSAAGGLIWILLLEVWRCKEKNVSTLPRERNACTVQVALIV